MKGDINKKQTQKKKKEKRKIEITTAPHSKNILVSYRTRLTRP